VEGEEITPSTSLSKRSKRGPSAALTLLGVGGILREKSLVPFQLHCEVPMGTDAFSARSMPCPIVLALFLVVSLEGCAQPSSGVRPETSTPLASRIQGPGGGDVYLTSELSKGTYSIPADPEVAWTHLAAVFEELGIEIAYQDPARKAMGNRNFRARRIDEARNSRYLDCGYGRTAVPHADAYDVTASLVVALRPAEDRGTVLETLFTAAARSRDVSGGNIPCSSKGTLERTIANRLAIRALGKAPGG
jgi:hypothetical protein